MSVSGKRRGEAATLKARAAKTRGAAATYLRVLLRRGEGLRGGRGVRDEPPKKKPLSRATTSDTPRRTTKANAAARNFISLGAGAWRVSLTRTRTRRSIFNMAYKGLTPPPAHTLGILVISVCAVGAPDVADRHTVAVAPSRMIPGLMRVWVGGRHTRQVGAGKGGGGLMHNTRTTGRRRRFACGCRRGWP